MAVNDDIDTAVKRKEEKIIEDAVELDEDFIAHNYIILLFKV